MKKKQKYKKISIYFLYFCFFILPLSIHGQTINGVTFTEIPVDLQLVARNASNKGLVKFEGKVDFSETPYDKIQIEVLREGLNYDNIVSPLLDYNSNIADFKFDIEIDAELANYSFVVSGLTSGSPEEITTVNDVVAGDVYIIQGQSNAVAEVKDFIDTHPDNTSLFIRTFSGLLNKDSAYNDTYTVWNEARDDIDKYDSGFIGQWGLKLGNLIVTNNHIPVAIFNGARGGKGITYFLEDAPPGNNEGPNTNNYDRLLYRLNRTNLADKVKAIFWSQGENNPNLNTYITSFEDLMNSWGNDYQNLEKIYIFQTKSGCNSTIGGSEHTDNKEAQRKIAESNKNFVHLIQTAGLKYVYPDNDQNCHFQYFDGYEGFAERLFNLLENHFYGKNLDRDIETPMIQEAYMIDDMTLIVDTDAISLSNNQPPDLSEFILDDSNNNSVNILDVDLIGSQIIFYLDKPLDQGSTSTISYKGLGAGENATNDVRDDFIFNTRGIEIACFMNYPIDKSKFTIWNGGSWSNDEPDDSMNAIIKGNYNDTSIDLIVDNLIIRSGFTLNFDGGTTNNIIINGDLRNDGTFKLGDQESLVMIDEFASIEGEITKIERSAVKVNQYAVAYWSSPVENEDLSVFTDVDPERIFTLNPLNEGPYSGIYKHWDIASGKMELGIGYSVDGPNNCSDCIQSVSFTGKPNNGLKEVDIFIDNSDPDTGYDSNLIGNPYPSAIDADAFINDVVNKDMFTRAIYFWNQQNDYEGGEYENDYITYNLLGGINSAHNRIASGQGFVILAEKEGKVRFKNSMRVKDNAIFHKEKDERDKVWLKLKGKSNLSKEVLIGFVEDATDGYDHGYDALSLSISEDKIYSVLNDKKFVIQGLGTFNNEKEVGLGIDISKPDTYSISISRLNGALEKNEIYLVDNLLGITHDLKSADYEFKQNKKGEFLKRFTLKFKSSGILGIDDYVIDNYLIFSNDADGLKVKANSVVNEIRVFDVLGRLILQTRPMKPSFVLKLDNIKNGSILMVEATFDNGAILNKKAIKY